jgi:iron complex outermembrane receptor protein
MANGNWRTHLATSVAVVAMASASPAQAQTKTFNVPSQAAVTAIPELARQADIQILVTEGAVRGKTTRAVSGKMSVDQALRVMLRGTGLSIATNDGRTITLSASSGSGEAVAGSAAAGEAGAENDIVVTGTNIPGSKPVGSAVITLDRKKIDQSGYSTVTDVIRSIPQNFGGGPNPDTSGSPSQVNNAGSNYGRGSGINLRGLGTESTLTLINGKRMSANGSGSIIDISLIPLVAVERIEVLADGASAIYGSDAIGGVVNVILRDHFDGAETTARFGSVTNGGQREYQASQVVGKDWQTGHILAAYNYSKIDPLYAHERSFTRTSDLRPLGGHDYGRPYGNPGNIIAGGQTYAIPRGQNGRSLVASSLIAGTSNVQNINEGLTMLTGKEQHSLYIYGSQELFGGSKFWVDGQYSHRSFEDRNVAEGAILNVPSSNPFFVDPVGGLSSVTVNYSLIDDLGPRTVRGTTDSYRLSAGLDVGLGRSWTAQVYGTLSHERERINETRYNDFYITQLLADPNPATAFNPFGDGSFTNPATIDRLRGYTKDKYDTYLRSANLLAGGTLFSLPGGAVKVAMGGEYREEGRESDSVELLGTAAPVSTTRLPLSRNVLSAFGEVVVPLVGPENRFFGFNSLALTAAVRYSKYSNLEQTTDPKFGVDWKPIADLTLRGTYGESFRAPNLVLYDDSRNYNFIAFAPDSNSPSGSTVSLVRAGSNSDTIGPEKAKIWTVGFDYKPMSIPGLSISGSYFHINYRNRIVSAITEYGSILSQDKSYAPIIIRNPTSSQIAAITGGPYPTYDFTGQANATIAAIVDIRSTNVSVSNVRGLDASLSYHFLTSVGTFSADLSGTYYLKFLDQFSLTAPSIDTVGTTGKPVDFSARASINWTSARWSTSLFANYLAGYTNTQVTPTEPVSSYLTFDGQIAYEIDSKGHAPSWLKGVTASFSVRNIFDRAPPFVDNLAGVAFDPEKASAQGRFISVQVSKRF